MPRSKHYHVITLSRQTVSHTVETVPTNEPAHGVVLGQAVCTSKLRKGFGVLVFCDFLPVQTEES